ncbi:uncharacterized protein [Rutidosis leptorrhynchoides]|uniref:uncharacterized protein n=1 Tax=Rutidosis leptorrhynchoides TaxID=125765 RepID=UPI003A9959BF
MPQVIALKCHETKIERREESVEELAAEILASGLKINVAKSNIFGVGVSNRNLNALASVTGCSVGVFPTTYLGITIGSNMKLVNNWQPLLNRFRSKLSSWKANLLSIGGRTTFIKSVLESLAIYSMSLFKCPEKF